jgi:hypothetical protein
VSPDVDRVRGVIRKRLLDSARVAAGVLLLVAALSARVAPRPHFFTRKAIVRVR